MLYTFAVENIQVTKMKIEEINIMFPDEPVVFVPDELLMRMEQAIGMMETSLQQMCKAKEELKANRKLNVKQK